jgi:hypothetical protein
MPTPPPSDLALRASDADRERIAEALRRHHLDGRLDVEELQERLGRCYAARTWGELRTLTADLPAEQPPPAPRRARPPARPPAFGLLLAGALVLVVLTAAAIAHGHPGPFPLLALFLVLRLWHRPRRRPVGRAGW